MVRTRASSSDTSFTSWPALPDPQEGNGTTVKIQYKAKIRWDKKVTSKSKVNDKESEMSSAQGLKIIAQEKVRRVFNCPVCLTLPACDIYQCNEGHLICMDCYNKLKTKSPILCPTCRTTLPRVPIRNRAAEQVN